MRMLIRRDDSATGGWSKQTPGGSFGFSGDFWVLLRPESTHIRRREQGFVESGSTPITPPLSQPNVAASEILEAIEERLAPLAPLPLPEGGTGRPEDFEAIEEAVGSLSGLVAPEELELGMDTPLIPALYQLVRTHGEGAVFELAASIGSSEIDPYVGTWILRWLGRLSDDRTHRARRWLLERSLHSPVPMIRDGAAQGLAALGDHRVLPALRAALDRERYSRLRRHIEKALRQVESRA